MHGEACAIAGVNSMDLNNWVQRKVIDFGTTMVGRRVYSIIDLVKLRVIGNLARTSSSSPHSLLQSPNGCFRARREIAALDNNGKLIHRHDS